MKFVPTWEACKLNDDQWAIDVWFVDDEGSVVSRRVVMQGEERQMMAYLPTQLLGMSCEVAALCAAYEDGLYASA